ncbi:AbrB/MazE/SpoVT family DNA-binding domain-containing protein [Latilactobacillus sakei]|uniref:AbrB/MazE/SpoVT family DNA-binding domain-containing protein n=1 Tax=Latilactobacillus sakei TaxID=1599 RepID=UPI000DC64501|nr:AbrB/MazE/SpoVT family DNA-binding domain-containing protein [Latilactobacillus sakei]SPS07522.1 SpoVT / AbrB like domain protein [Latilactobacillus sakei]
MSQTVESKLQKVGESIAVSLPQNWLLMNDLDEGDFVRFRINENGSLTVESIEKQTQKNKVFKELIQQDHDLIMRLRNV